MGSVKKQDIKFSKPNRFVVEVFHHHSASSSPSYRFEAIEKDHKATSYYDGKGIAYHYLIDYDGTLLYGRNLEDKPQAQAMHNTGTIAICLLGIKDSFTEAQFETLRELDKKINQAYKGKIRFRSHKDINATECPHYAIRSILNLDEKGFMPYEKSTWKKVLGFFFKIGVGYGISKIS